MPIQLPKRKKVSSKKSRSNKDSILLEKTASEMTNYVADMLDQLSSGVPFGFERTEEYFLQCLKECVNNTKKKEQEP